MIRSASNSQIPFCARLLSDLFDLFFRPLSHQKSQSSHRLDQTLATEAVTLLKFQAGACTPTNAILGGGRGKGLLHSLLHPLLMSGRIVYHFGLAVERFLSLLVLNPAGAWTGMGSAHNQYA